MSRLSNKTRIVAGAVLLGSVLAGCSDIYYDRRDTVRTPLDPTLPANDVDFFIKNKAEVLRTEVRGGAAAVERGPIGHMLELPQGGIYVVAK